MIKHKLELKRWLPEKKSVKLLISTLLLTLGVYFAYPERGLSATFPVLFLFAFAGSLVYPAFWFAPAGAFAIAMFYGVMANFSDPFAFALFSLLSALCAALCAAALKGMKKSRWKYSLLFFVALIPGLLAPLLFAGTPAAYQREKQSALDYLDQNYPDQVFDDMTFYFDLRERVYRAAVSYDNEGNTLTSHLVFGDRVEDGYRVDYTDYVLRRHASQLIEAFQEKELSVVTEAAGLLVGREEPLPGVYGTISEAILPETCFSVTFREEKPQREAFRDAIAEAMMALQEKEVVFGEITFYALDAGNVIYQCSVTPATAPEEILALITHSR